MTVVNTNRHYLTTYLYSMGYLVKVTDDSYYISDRVTDPRHGGDKYPRYRYAESDRGLNLSVFEAA